MNNPLALVFREFFGRGKNIISFEELYKMGITTQNIEEANLHLEHFGLKIDRFSKENKQYFFINALDESYQEDSSLTSSEAMLLDYIIIKTSDKTQIPESQIHHSFEGNSHLGGRTISLLKKLEGYSLIIRNEGNVSIAPLAERIINIPLLRQKLIQESQIQPINQKSIEENYD